MVKQLGVRGAMLQEESIAPRSLGLIVSHRRPEGHRQKPPRRLRTRTDPNQTRYERKGAKGRGPPAPLGRPSERERHGVEHYDDQDDYPSQDLIKGERPPEKRHPSIGHGSSALQRCLAAGQLMEPCDHRHHDAANRNRSPYPWIAPQIGIEVRVGAEECGLVAHA